MRTIVLTVFYSLVFMALIPALYFFKERMYGYFFALMGVCVLLFVARCAIYNSHKSKQKSKKSAIKLILSIVVVSSSIGLNSCSSTPDVSDASDRNTSRVVAEHFIKQRLNYPAEAKFEGSTTKHEYLGGNRCTVLGKFETKNAFGVRSEYVYKIWLKYNGGEWSDFSNWENEKLKIEEYK